MERQPSPNLERATSFEIDEPLTLTKEQYQAALAAVMQSYNKGNASMQPVGEKQPQKITAKVAAKGCIKL